MHVLREHLLDHALLLAPVILGVAAIEGALQRVEALDQVRSTPQQIAEADELLALLRSGDDELNANRQAVLGRGREARDTRGRLIGNVEAVLT